MIKNTAASNNSAGCGGGDNGANTEGSGGGGASTSTDSGTNGSGNSASTSGSTTLTAAELQMLFGMMDTALLMTVKIMLIIAFQQVKVHRQKSQASQTKPGYYQFHEPFIVFYLMKLEITVKFS